MSPIEFKEKCQICRRPISCWGYDGTEEYHEDDPGCTGIVCDHGNRESCLKHFCSTACYDKHKCDAHRRKV